MLRLIFRFNYMYIQLNAYEPQHDKTNSVACAPSEDSNQTGQIRPVMLQMRSLICAFVACIWHKGFLMMWLNLWLNYKLSLCTTKGYKFFPFLVKQGFTFFRQAFNEWAQKSSPIDTTWLFRSRINPTHMWPKDRLTPKEVS